MVWDSHCSLIHGHPNQTHHSMQHHIYKYIVGKSKNGMLPSVRTIIIHITKIGIVCFTNAETCLICTQSWLILKILVGFRPTPRCSKELLNSSAHIWGWVEGLRSDGNPPVIQWIWQFMAIAGNIVGCFSFLIGHLTHSTPSPPSLRGDLWSLFNGHKFKICCSQTEDGPNPKKVGVTLLSSAWFQGEMWQLKIFKHMPF